MKFTLINWSQTCSKVLAQLGIGHANKKYCSVAKQHVCDLAHVLIIRGKSSWRYGLIAFHLRSDAGSLRSAGTCLRLVFPSILHKKKLCRASSGRPSNLDLPTTVGAASSFRQSSRLMLGYEASCVPAVRAEFRSSTGKKQLCFFGVSRNSPILSLKTAFDGVES